MVSLTHVRFDKAKAGLLAILSGKFWFRIMQSRRSKLANQTIIEKKYKYFHRHIFNKTRKVFLKRGKESTNQKLAR